MTADDYAKVIEAALAMKPTPGPWHWEADEVKNDPTGRVRYQVTTLGKTVTRVYYSSFEGGPTNAEADAALIAACHPEALHALLEERKAMRELLARAAGEIAGLRNELGCVVGGRIESTDVEHAIKAALTTTADSQDPPKGQ